MRTFRSTALLGLFCLTFSLSSVGCGSKETTVQTSTMKKDSNGIAAVDPNEKFDTVAIAGADHRIYFRPPVGGTFRYHVVEQTTSTAHLEGVPEQAPNHAQSKRNEYYIWTQIKSYDKDSALTMDVRVDSVRIQASQDTAKIAYASTSAADAGNPQYNEMNAVIGKQFSVIVDRMGNIKKITNYATILSGLTKAFPDSLKANARFKSIADQETQQTLFNYIMQAVQPVPTGTVKQDTVWRQHQEGNLPVPPIQVPITMDATQTMKGFQKHGSQLIAVIDDSTSTTPKKKTIEEGPITVTIDHLIATSHGRQHIDDATGMLLSRTIQQHQSVKVAMSSKQQPGKTQSMEQNATVNSTVEMIQ